MTLRDLLPGLRSFNDAAKPRGAPTPEPTKPKLNHRKPLRRVSKKRAALNRKVKPMRDEYKAGECMKCRKVPADDCHEIATAAAREQCLTEWSLVIALCRSCHSEVQNWTPATQIALLAAYRIDKACERYCELKGYAPSYVSRNSVLTALEYNTAITGVKRKPKMEAKKKKKQRS